MTTALSAYGSNVASSVLTTACSLATATGGTLASKTTTAPNDSSQNYLEVLSQGGTGTTYASLPAPTGHGWIADGISLSGNQFVAGNWSSVARMSLTTGTMTNTLVQRYWVYNSVSLTYTAIGSITTTGNAFSTTTTSYSDPFTALGASPIFGANDYLYIDEFVKPTTGTWTGQGVKNVVTTSAAQGDASNFAITTPGYASVTTTTYSFTEALSASDSLLVTQIVLPVEALSASEKMLATDVWSLTEALSASDSFSGTQVTPLVTTTYAFVEALVASDSLLVTEIFLPVETVPVSESFSGVVTPAFIASGQFGVWANGTGTASFDSFRCTQYPDPALSLAPVLPYVNSSSSFWTENIPNGTSRSVYTTLDGSGQTWNSATNGGPITGITSQGAVMTDVWLTNSGANYTSTAKTGGSVATITYDTTNSRITLVGGSGALYLYSATSTNQVDVLCTMDESDAGGLCWCFVDASDYYELGVYDDSSSSGFTNQLRLYKVLSNTRTLLSFTAISFARSTPGVSPYHAIRATMQGGVINVYFDSSVPVLTYTDGSPLAAGQAGLRNDGGTSRYYELRLQALGDYVGGSPAGDIVSAKFLYTRVDPSSTDPTVSAQVLGLTTSVRSPSIDAGVLIPQLHIQTYPVSVQLPTEFDTLTKASGDYHYMVDQSGFLNFNLRGAKICPWVLYSTDLLFAPKVTPSGAADLYRNQEQIYNCLTTTQITNEQHVADGTSTSWQATYPLYSAPTIVINNVTQSIGIANVDTGKAFYWTPGTSSISQDASATKLLAGTIQTWSYTAITGRKTITLDNLAEQQRAASVEKNSGIVTNTLDGSTVYGLTNLAMTVAQATTYGNGLLARFSNNNAINLVAVTSSDKLGSRPAPQKGCLMPTFLPEFKINNRFLLITRVLSTATQKGDGTLLYDYRIEATDGANLSNWVQPLL